MVAGSLLALTGSASAQAPRQVRFEYERQDGAAACPNATSIQAGVAARLGYEPFDNRADDHLRATIRLIGHDLEARIEMTDANGRLKAERKLVSHQRDCIELASSVELAVSIAIDPFRLNSSPDTRGLRRQEVEPAAVHAVGESAETAQPQQVEPVVQSTSKPVVSDEPRRPISGRVEAGVAGIIGAAPSTTLGFAVGAGIRDGNLSLGIEGRADLPASSALREGEASTSLLVASLVPCMHFRMLAACALATAGVLRAAGHGLVDSRHVTLPYLALGARLVVAIPIAARLSLALHGDVTTPLTETELDVDGSAVWTSPHISFGLGIGVVAAFP